MKTLKFKNDLNIKTVFWKSREIQNYCPLGKDYCTYAFEVELNAGEYLFDYDALHEWVDLKLNGKTHTREEATSILYSYLIKELRPSKLRVRTYNTLDNSYVEI